MAGIYISESAAPSAPAVGKVVIYAKTDGFLYIKDDAGTETQLTLAGGAITASSFTMTTDRLLGRDTASTGAIEELTLGNGLTLTAGALVVQSASETVDGILELATQAEVNAMTDTSRALTANHNKLILGTEQASTSGTSIDFTSIPSGVRRITVEFVSVSTNGVDAVLIQIGDSGGVETTGYLGASCLIASGSAGGSTYTNGFAVNPGGVAFSLHGSMVLSLEDSAGFTWTATGLFSQDASNSTIMSAFSKSLSATLDRVRITTTGGTNTFDAGAINILYER